MQVLTEREPTLAGLKDHIARHPEHDNSDVMALGSLMSTLGIIDENQATTAGTIQILNNCLQYSNDKGVNL